MVISPCSLTVWRRTWWDRSVPTGARHGSARNAIAAVEAAYSLEGTDNEWLGRILDALRPDMETNGGSYAFVCRIHDGRLDVGPGYVERNLDPGFAAVVAELNRTAPGAFFALLERQAVITGAFSDVVGHLFQAHLDSHAAPHGVFDALEIFAQDGEGYALNVVAPARLRVHASPRVRGIWKRIGFHAASGMRLRRRLAAMAGDESAVFAPDGRLVHAEDNLRDNVPGREALSRAVRAMERARTASERAHPERALELWKGLVAGEWSLVDTWTGGGRRHIAAYRNAPAVKDPRALTARERVVLQYASRCASNKEIGFALGLSESTIASAVSGILRKLRCRRRSDLLALAHVDQALHAEVAVGGNRIGVLSLSGGVRSPLADKLSAAERDIAALLVDGKTNAEIARARGTSQRTVADQVHGIFEKLGLRGRSELVNALTRE